LGQIAVTGSLFVYERLPPRGGRSSNSQTPAEVRKSKPKFWLAVVLGTLSTEKLRPVKFLISTKVNRAVFFPEQILLLPTQQIFRQSTAITTVSNRPDRPEVSEVEGLGLQARREARCVQINSRDGKASRMVRRLSFYLGAETL
jgi:hypothetical protein